MAEAAEAAADVDQGCRVVFVLLFFPRDKRIKVMWGGDCAPGRHMYSTDGTLCLFIMALQRVFIDTVNYSPEESKCYG